MRRLMIVLFSLLSMAVLAGCQSNPSTAGGPAELTAGGHGGGFAVMRNGHYLSIDDAGAVTGRCQLCDSTDGAACAEKAKASGIPVCSGGAAMPAAKARTAMTCATYGPSGPLPPVEFGTPGYTCYMTSPHSCICMLN
jgi:hypothetical protein